MTGSTRGDMSPVEGAQSLDSAARTLPDQIERRRALQLLVSSRGWCGFCGARFGLIEDVDGRRCLQCGRAVPTQGSDKAGLQRDA
jgi:hypothetical protein